MSNKTLVRHFVDTIRVGGNGQTLRLRVFASEFCPYDGMPLNVHSREFPQRKLMKRTRKLARIQKPETVVQKILNHLCHLSAAYRVEKDPVRKSALEIRILKLESYVVVVLSHTSRDKERAVVVLNFARVLLKDWQRTWDDYRKRVDDYQEKIRARPRGRPIERRYQVAEALDRKLANPSKTWKQIAQDLNLNSEQLPREITRLRRLLTLESIEFNSDSNVGRHRDKA
jgi:hypothetical protein